MAGDRINVRVDPEAYVEAKAILDELGVSSSMAVNSFFRAVVRERGFPFPLTTRPLSELAAEEAAQSREEEEGDD